MNKLIVGCGYLGRRVAKLWHAAGHRVTGVVRRNETAAELASLGIHTVVADVTKPARLAALPPAETLLYSVGYDPTSGSNPHAVYCEGLLAVLTAAVAPARVILISSTGVYSECEGGWVDEDSPCGPVRDSGRALLAAEQLLASHPLGSRGIVLRLAGIYGPGRLPRWREIARGEPIVTPAGGNVNLIHVDDAARAVLAAEAYDRPPRTYLVADGHPVDRRTYLTRLAEVMRLPAPRFLDPEPGTPRAGRGAGDKRVGNSRLRSELGFVFQYPTYVEGLAAAVREG